MVDVVVEKHVNALNESLINFFRQGVSSNHGIGSPVTSISLMCQIYNAIDHISIVCPKIENIKPKCDKCGLSHKTKIMDPNVGTTYVWDILKIDVRRRARRPNHTTNNYLEVLMDDETTTLEQLNRLCGTKHDIFSGAHMPKRKLLVEMQQH
jgi:hypothetical protein